MIQQNNPIVLPKSKYQRLKRPQPYDGFRARGICKLSLGYAENNAVHVKTRIGVSTQTHVSIKLALPVCEKVSGRLLHTERNSVIRTIDEVVGNDVLNSVP